MALSTPARRTELCLPPHGGSGLKFCFFPLSRVGCGLPPHGGSGLKWVDQTAHCVNSVVSLHTEGVD